MSYGIKGQSGVRKPSGESSTRFLTKRQGRMLQRGGGPMKKKPKPMPNRTGQFM
jgi:hypothetical protein